MARRAVPKNDCAQNVNSVNAEKPFLGPLENSVFSSKAACWADSAVCTTPALSYKEALPTSFMATLLFT